MARRRVALLAALALATAVILGSAGASAVVADRGLQIAVAPDEEAFLGLEVDDPALPNGNHEDVELVALRNNFPNEIVRVEAAVAPGESPTPPLLAGADPVRVSDRRLPVGATATVTADITCSGNAEPVETVDVSIAVETAGGSTVELTRAVQVTCTGEPNRGASARGNATATPTPASG